MGCCILIMGSEKSRLLRALGGFFLSAWLHKSGGFAVYCKYVYEYTWVSYRGISLIRSGFWVVTSSSKEEIWKPNTWKITLFTTGIMVRSSGFWEYHYYRLAVQGHKSGQKPKIYRGMDSVKLAIFGIMLFPPPSFKIVLNTQSSHAAPPTRYRVKL